MYTFEPNTGRFWNMYRGETNMVIHEMDGTTMSPTEFNKLCDKNKMHVNIKGSTGGCNVENIFINTNYWVDTWWSGKGVRLAYFRRIHELHWHYAFKQKEVFISDPWEENPTIEGTACYKFLEAHPEFKPFVT